MSKQKKQPQGQTIAMRQRNKPHLVSERVLVAKKSIMVGGVVEVLIEVLHTCKRACSGRRCHKYPWGTGQTKGSPTVLPREVIRSTDEEKEAQITTRNILWESNKDKSAEVMKNLQIIAVKNGNLFEGLMEAVKYCSLGQITGALFEVGGQYRRNM